jgi:CRP/FNR family transcriptional regulator, cyclic AMP receptor protein
MSGSQIEIPESTRTQKKLSMISKPEILRSVPLFALLDDDETAVLAGQVELRSFAAGAPIYKIGEPGQHAYIVISGKIRVSTVDDDQQEVVIDEPSKGEFFGFASMLEQTPHQTMAIALEDTVCLEVSRDDIAALLERKPHAGMDLLSTLGRQFHAAQQLVRVRATRNANEIIERKASWSERIADSVARFGGSWTFIIIFIGVIAIYSLINIMLRKRAWDPYPFILLNLFLSMLAAIQAPVIMMSQNRQDTKDRLRGELDYDVNRRAESEIQALSRKLNLLDEKVDEMVNLVRNNATSYLQRNGGGPIHTTTTSSGD